MTSPPIVVSEKPAWPHWQRVLFRFFAVYLVLQMAPWNWFDAIPGLPLIFNELNRLFSQLVYWSNDHLVHIRDTLVRPNGSGDTSWAWAQFYFYLIVAVVACVVWSVLDRKRPQYERALYWLRLTVRYYVATFALSYGIIKLFALQMSFPGLSQLATPLGDLLPMRFSWLFIGYSFPYQVFSGVMETVAGLLLLYRRTVTAGLFAATGAFINVVMINLSYDVPVKLFASHLLLACLFLLALDSKRLLNLLVLNRAVEPTTAYDPPPGQPWAPLGRAAVKIFFVFQILIFPLNSAYTRYKSTPPRVSGGPFPMGIYDVRSFVVNHDTIPPSTADTLRWKDVIFDAARTGSVNSTDTLFWQRYRRGYFSYTVDTARRTIAVTHGSFVPGQTTPVFTARYVMADSNNIHLDALMRSDTLHVDLVRVPRHFQLTERQFHWISEYNR